MLNAFCEQVRVAASFYFLVFTQLNFALSFEVTVVLFAPFSDLNLTGQVRLMIWNSVSSLFDVPQQNYGSQVAESISSDEMKEKAFNLSFCPKSKLIKPS